MQSEQLDKIVKLLCGTDTWHWNGLTFKDGPVGIVRNDDNSFNETYILPSPVALSSTFNPELAFKVGKYLSSNTKNTVILSPAINIKRNSLNGRNYEYFSEDPIINGVFGYQIIKGINESSSSRSCLKHFAFNNQENYRCTASSNVSEETAFEIYLKAFKIAIKAEPIGLMMAYNRFNGVYCCENEMLYKIARDMFDYKGAFISDWNAVSNIVNSLKVGLDLEMPGPRNNNKELFENGLLNNEITEDFLNLKVEHTKSVLSINEKKVDEYKPNSEEVRKLLTDIEREAIVLLKNEDHVLPIKKLKISVFGLLAKKPIRQGYGSSRILNEKETDDVLELPINHYLDCYDEKGLKTAFWSKIPKCISKAGVNLVFVGNFIETECIDRKTLRLDPVMEELIEEVSKYSNNVVVVLQTGSAVVMPWIDKVKGVVQMHFGGSFCLSALSDLLVGISDFSGKLTESYPKDDLNIIALKHKNDYFNVDYKEEKEVGYRYYVNHSDELLFPFGYGLSYYKYLVNSFNVQLSFEFKSEDDNLVVSIGFSKKTKSFFYDYPIQIYLNEEGSSEIKLVFFNKIQLAEVDDKIELQIPYDNLTSYNVELHSYEIANKNYCLSVRNNSSEVIIEKHIHLSSTVIEKKFLDYINPYSNSESSSIPINEDYPIKLLENLPEGKEVYQSIYKLIHNIKDIIGDLFFEYSIDLPIRAIGSHLGNTNITKYLVAKINNNQEVINKYKEEVPELLR
jgi:beta-glucosidase